MIEVEKVHGIGEYEVEKKGEDVFYRVPEGKVFVAIRPKTLEVRCDRKLSKVLCEKYETVMESRYFGRGGIEIVPSGQLEENELEDLVRLSYNLTMQEAERNEL